MTNNIMDQIVMCANGDTGSTTITQEDATAFVLWLRDELNARYDEGYEQGHADGMDESYDDHGYNMHDHDFDDCGYDGYDYDELDYGHWG